MTRPKRATRAEARAVTLANGVEVRVGETVPMTGGGKGVVIVVDQRDGLLRVNLDGYAVRPWFNADGTPRFGGPYPAIDLAALAAQRAKAPAGERTLTAAQAAYRAGAEAMREAAAKVCDAEAKYHDSECVDIAKSVKDAYEREGALARAISRSLEASHLARNIRALKPPALPDAALLLTTTAH